jgi:hypothetical protein
MPGILVGYARTSTCDQQAGLDAQFRDLKAIGCEEIFAEQVSAVAQRDRLKEALRFVRRGDTLVACKLDRLAGSTTAHGHDVGGCRQIRARSPVGETARRGGRRRGLTGNTKAGDQPHAPRPPR